VVVEGKIVVVSKITEDVEVLDHDKEKPVVVENILVLETIGSAIYSKSVI
jgi:hypothetical protein